MKKNPTLWIGTFGCSLLAIMFVIGPILPKVDPHVSMHSYILGKSNLDFILPPYSPSSRFLLGSDQKGRDVYSFLVIGTRATFETVGSITILTFLLAFLLGIGASHSQLLKRMLQGWNYFFSRIPLLFFMILWSTIPFFIFSPHRSLWMIVIIVLLEAGKVADIVYADIKNIQTTTYFEAGIISGSRLKGLWRQYYWPGCYPQWLSLFIQHLGSILFLLAQLGVFSIFISQHFVQLPGGPGTPTYSIENSSLIWPVLLSNVYNDLLGCPWVPISAACFITFAMLSFNMLGDGLLQYMLMKQNGIITTKGRRLFPFKKREVEILNT
jgi:peptide/nickel transport system permease protein